MIDISSSRLINVIVHRIGNKIREEGIKLAERESNASESLCSLFSQHYLLPLSKQDEIYDFFHESDLSLNVVSNISEKIFKSPDEFIQHTQSLAKHLYSTSTHPNISGGDVVFLLFTGIISNEKPINGLAILKIESKDDFIDIKEASDCFEIVERTGIALNKIQKGALILSNSEGVSIIDNLGQKTKYWLESFLKLSPRATSKSYSKACGLILKGIATKVDVSVASNLTERIKDELESTETTSIGEIKKISSDYIDSESISEIMSGVISSTGFNIEDEYEFKSSDLAKQAKSISNKIRVRDGVGLVISNSNLSVSGISINDHEEGFQAVIDIKTRKKK